MKVKLNDKEAHYVTVCKPGIVYHDDVPTHEGTYVGQPISIDGKEYLKCSECGEALSYGYWGMPVYCPHCGQEIRYPFKLSNDNWFYTPPILIDDRK